MTVVIVANPVHGHSVISKAYAEIVKPLTMAGRRVLIDIKEAEDDRSVRQNAFYWGVVLRDISDQASIDGQRWGADAWHQLFKRQFLPRRVTKCSVAGRSKKVVSVSLGSTTELSVRKMSDYLDRVQAFAATDLGVQFSVANWEDWR